MQPSKGMKACGILSSLFGLVGVTFISLHSPPILGWIVGTGGLLIVGIAHNWVFGGRMD